MPKIAGVKMLAEPSDTAKALTTLGRADEVVVVGAVKDGYVSVTPLQLDLTAYDELPRIESMLDSGLGVRD